MKRAPAVFVFSALFALPAPADDAPPAPPAAATASASSTTPAAKTPAKKAAPRAAAGSANMIVTKDPDTGELRPATAAEREKLLGRQPLAAPEHKVVTLPDGSVMVELGEADRSYAVATRNADGTLSRTCVHGAAEAAKAAKAAKAAPSPAPTSSPAPPATDR